MWTSNVGVLSIFVFNNLPQKHFLFTLTNKQQASQLTRELPLKLCALKCKMDILFKQSNHFVYPRRPHDDFDQKHRKNFTIWISAVQFKIHCNKLRRRGRKNLGAGFPHLRLRIFLETVARNAKCTLSV